MKTSMGNYLSLSSSEEQQVKRQQVKLEDSTPDKKEAEAVKIWPTPEDPCTYLKAPAGFGDPRVYMIDDGRLPLVPHFEEYATTTKFQPTTAPQELSHSARDAMSHFLENIKTRGWYPPSELTEQQAEWLSNPKVLEALLQRFVAALHRRRVIHPVFTKTRTTHRLKIDYNATKSSLNVQYCVADPSGWWIYDRDVPRDALLSGSLWHDVEYHERHNTPEAGHSSE